LLVRKLAALQRHRCAIDGGQRCAELVRRDGDELVLQPVELAQTIDRVVLPTLVERDRDERPHERDRKVRRVVPQSDEDDGKRRHDRERHSRRDERSAQRLQHRLGAQSREEQPEQADVDDVEHRRNNERRNAEHEQTALAECGCRRTRRGGRDRVDAGVEGNANGGAPPPDLDRRHG
jgi:hypothetical protein